MFIDAGFVREMLKEGCGDIASLIVTTPDTASRKVLADNGAVRICLYALDGGTSGSVAAGKGSVSVRAVQGPGVVQVAGHDYTLETGESILFPGDNAFSFRARETPFKVLTLRVYEDTGAVPQEDMNGEQI